MQGERPIIIVNEQGFKLIQELADLAFRGTGLNAYTTFDTIVKSTQSYGQFISEYEDKLKKDNKKSK